MTQRRVKVEEAAAVLPEGIMAMGFCTSTVDPEMGCPGNLPIELGMGELFSDLLPETPDCCSATSWFTAATFSAIAEMMAEFRRESCCCCCCWCLKVARVKVA